MFDKCLWPSNSVGGSYNFVTVFNELCFDILEIDTKCNRLKLINVGLLKKAIMQNL